MAGANESKGGVSSAVKDENSVAFEKNASDFEAIRDFVEAKIAARFTRGTEPPPASPQQSSVSEQIRELAALRDDGLLNSQAMMAEVFWCQVCDENRSADASFCHKCGERVSARRHKPAPEVPVKVSEAVVSSATVKRVATKQLVIGLSLVISLVIGATTFAARSLNQAYREEQLLEQAAEIAAAARAENLIEAFGQDEVLKYLPDCDEVASFVLPYHEKWEPVVANFSRVRDPREASQLLKDPSSRVANRILEDSEVKAYSKTFYERLGENLQALTASTTRVEAPPLTQRNSWGVEWRTLAREACPVEFEAFDNAFESLQASAAEYKRLSTLASRVPWYPEDFSPLATDVSGNLVKKWVGNAGNSCYRCGYVTLDVISQRGCPAGVYIEVNWLDSSGRVVDWTNDSLPYLGALQVGRLQFEHYLPGSGYSARVVGHRC
jgi:hypothetical protein